METRTCIACNSTIRGRSDKRFCDDGCRSAYNNKLNSVPNNFVRDVNIILRKNRRILREILMEKQVGKVKREQLLAMGLSFKYFTNAIEDAKGQIYWFVYEYGYVALDEDFFLLVKQNIGDDADM